MNEKYSGQKAKIDALIKSITAASVESLGIDGSPAYNLAIEQEAAKSAAFETAWPASAVHARARFDLLTLADSPKRKVKLLDYDNITLSGMNVAAGVIGFASLKEKGFGPTAAMLVNLTRERIKQSTKAYPAGSVDVYMYVCGIDAVKSSAAINNLSTGLFGSVNVSAPVDRPYPTTSKWKTAGMGKSVTVTASQRGEMVTSGVVHFVPVHNAMFAALVRSEANAFTEADLTYLGPLFSTYGDDGYAPAKGVGVFTTLPSSTSWSKNGELSREIDRYSAVGDASGLWLYEVLFRGLNSDAVFPQDVIDPAVTKTNRTILSAVVSDLLTDVLFDLADGKSRFDAKTLIVKMDGKTNLPKTAVALKADNAVYAAAQEFVKAVAVKYGYALTPATFKKDPKIFVALAIELNGNPANQDEVTPEVEKFGQALGEYFGYDLVHKPLPIAFMQ